MLQIGIRTLKAGLSEFVRRAANGETIVITSEDGPSPDSSHIAQQSCPPDWGSWFAVAK
jgi:hypothetical protein